MSSSPKSPTPFRKGTEVEINSNDDGFRGSWYAGTIVRSSATKPTVEYKTIMADEAGTRPLREAVDFVQLRPIPPRERERKFNFSEEVDAYYNDGWWEGVVTKVKGDGERYSVFFRGTREQLEFGGSELRLHREWVDGKWVPPLEDEVPSSTVLTDMKPSKETGDEKFHKGTLVEVCSDEEGFKGAWFAASIIEQLPNGNFLAEYQSLRNEDDTEFLREEFDSLHIRPYPPDSGLVASFNLLEEVDALYNDGWWVGVISKVINKQSYMVYFRGFDEEMKFKLSDLRPHQEWVAGKWVSTSQALKM